MQTIPHTINTGIICIPILVKLLLSVFEEIDCIFKFFFIKQKAVFALRHFAKKMDKSTQFPKIISKPIIDRPLFVPITPRPPPNYYFQPPPKIIIIEYQPPVPAYFKTIEKKN